MTNNRNVKKIWVDATNALDLQRILAYAFRIRSIYAGLYSRDAVNIDLPSDVRYVVSLYVNPEQLDQFQKQFRVFSDQ